MSNSLDNSGPDKEDQELAEVSRVVDEIARQIRMDQADDSFSSNRLSVSEDEAVSVKNDSILLAVADAVAGTSADINPEDEEVLALSQNIDGDVSEPELDFSGIELGINPDSLAVETESTEIEDVVEDEELKQFLSDLSPEMDLDDKSAADEVVQLEEKQPPTIAMTFPDSKGGSSSATSNSTIFSLFQNVLQKGWSARSKEEEARTDNANPQPYKQADVAVSAPEIAEVVPVKLAIPTVDIALKEDVSPTKENAVLSGAFDEMDILDDPVLGDPVLDDMDFSETKMSETDLTGDILSFEKINYDVRDVLNCVRLSKSPLQNFASFAEDLPLHFPMDQFRTAAQDGGTGFADALAETRSSAANITILLRYAEALLAEQSGDYVEGIANLEALGRPALDDPSIRYDLARIAELAEDLPKAKQEYHTLVNISGDVEIQQIALARLIDLSHKSDDIQAVPAFLRQLSVRVDDEARGRILSRFIGLIDKIENLDNRQWLLDSLLALEHFAEDLYLLQRGADLAELNADTVTQMAFLRRIESGSDGEIRLQALQKILSIFDEQNDVEQIEPTLRAIWAVAADNSPVLLKTLQRLADQANPAEDAVTALAVQYRLGEDTTALISTLTLLQDITQNAQLITDVMKELQQLHESAGNIEAADDIALQLLQQGNVQIDQIVQRVESAEGKRHEMWCCVLRDFAQEVADNAVLSIAYAGLITHAVDAGDTTTEIELLRNLTGVSDTPADSWMRVAIIARGQEDTPLLIEALDALLALNALGNDVQIALLNERIALHRQSSENLSAIALLQQLLLLVENRLPVLFELLDIDPELLRRDQQIAYCNDALSLLDTDAPEYISMLEKLRLLEPENPQHLQPLIAHYTQTNDFVALGQALMALQALQTAARLRIETLNSAIECFDAIGYVDAMDNALSVLFELIDTPLPSIAEHASACSGERARKWFTVLRERAQAFNDSSYELIALQGLIELSNDTPEKESILRDMLPLSSDSHPVWQQLLECYDPVDRRAEWLSALDKLVDNADGSGDLDYYLRIRIDAHLEDEEQEHAVKKLMQLFSISQTPLDVAAEMLSLGVECLERDQRIELYRALADHEQDSQLYKALFALSREMEESGNSLDALSMLLELRGFKNADNQEIDQKILPLMARIDIISALSSHSDLLAELKVKFPDTEGFSVQYTLHRFRQAIAAEDTVALEAITSDMLSHEDELSRCLQEPSVLIVKTINMLKNAQNSEPFLEKVMETVSSVKIRRSVAQLLAQRAEAKKDWQKAISCWNSAGLAAASEGDSLGRVRIQLRLFGLYRGLKMKAESEMLVKELAELPESIGAQLGQHLIQPLELYGVMCVREREAQTALRVLNRAVGLREANGKMDYTAATLQGNIAEVQMMLKNITAAEKSFNRAIGFLKQHPNQTPQIQQKLTALRGRLRMIDSHKELSRLQAKK